MENAIGEATGTADFIAASREALPKLLDEVERLKEELAGYMIQTKASLKNENQTLRDLLLSCREGLIPHGVRDEKCESCLDLTKRIDEALDAESALV